MREQEKKPAETQEESPVAPACTPRREIRKLKLEGRWIAPSAASSG